MISSNIQFFIEPYPDELLYSIIARWHMRSGNGSASATRRQLFGSKSILSSSFYSNNNIYKIASKLPKDIIDVKQIILDSTLFKFHYRFYDKTEKEIFLEKFIAGNSSNHGAKMKGKAKKQKEYTIKFCPLCKKMELKTYGESYWHTSHQIPGITICPVHKVRLVEYILKDKNSLDYSFMFPEQINECNINDKIDTFENTYNQYLYECFSLPWEMSPTIGYNNLITELINNGYGKIQNGFRIDYPLLKNKINTMILQSDFGRALNLTINPALVSKIKTFKFKAPENYICLMMLVNLTFADLFGNKLENKFEKNIKELELKGGYPTRAEVAKELGIKPQEVNRLANYYGVKQFWKQRAKEKKEIEPKYTIKTKVTKEEKEEIIQYMKNHKISNQSKFILDCIKKEIKNHEIIL